eukprot:Polyplicarium_translucidae@DN2764_c0_g2_i3.p1
MVDVNWYIVGPVIVSGTARWGKQRFSQGGCAALVVLLLFVTILCLRSKANKRAALEAEMERQEKRRARQLLLELQVLKKQQQPPQQQLPMPYQFGQPGAWSRAPSSPTPAAVQGSMWAFEPQPAPIAAPEMLTVMHPGTILREATHPMEYPSTAPPIAPPGFRAVPMVAE